MQRLGERLRAAREEKGVSASEAAQATKIKVQHIEALESEDFDKMAAPIYVKGFIKMYAQYLGLDQDELLEQYKSANAPLTPEQIVGNKGTQPKRASKILARSSKSEEPAAETTEKSEKTAPATTAAVLAGVKDKLQAARDSVKLPQVNWKQILTVLGGVLVLILIISTVKNCAQRAGKKAEKKELEQIEFIEDVPEPYLDPAQAKPRSGA